MTANRGVRVREKGEDGVQVLRVTCVKAGDMARSDDLEPHVSHDECDCAMRASCAMTVPVKM